MKFFRALMDSLSGLIRFGGKNFPPRLPREFVPEYRPPRFDDPPEEVPEENPLTQEDVKISEPVAELIPEPIPEQIPLIPDSIGKTLVAKGIITPSELSEALERQKQEPAKYLGQILVEMGCPQSKIIKGLYYSKKRKKVGEILVELNFITRKQLFEALHEQLELKGRGRHEYLAKLMIRRCFINETQYLEALSAHFSMPVISLKDYIVIPAMQTAVGERYALKNRIIVLDDENDIAVAIAEPHWEVLDHLEIAVPREKHILFYLARASEINHCLEIAYRHGDI